MEVFQDLAQQLEAVQSQNLQIRQRAEDTIRAYKSQDPVSREQLQQSKFLITLVYVLTQSQGSNEARQMASIIFKNAIINVTQEEGQGNMWFNLPEITRQQIKEGLQAQLGSQNELQIKNAGLCLAVLAHMELPLNMWQEFLPSMVQNSENPNYWHRFAAVQTLGFLAEFMEGCPLQQSDTEQMLYSTINNIQAQHPKICSIAMSALLRTIPSTAKNFEVDDQRNFIMNGIFQGLMIEDEEIQELSLQTLAEVPNVGYKQILQYLQRIGEFTMGVLQTDKLKQIKYSLLFWNNLCKEEIKAGDQSQLIVIGCFDSLMQIIFMGFSINEFDDDQTDVAESLDDEVWTIAVAAGNVLQDVSVICKDKVLEPVYEFFRHKIGSVKWQDQYAALLALQCALNGPSSQLIGQMCQPLFMEFFNLIQRSSVPKIVHVTAGLIAGLAKYAPEMILQQQVFTQILFTQGVAEFQKLNQVPAFTKMFFGQAFCGLFEGAKKLGALQQLQIYFTDTLRLLIEYMKQPQCTHANITGAIADCVCTIVESVSNFLDDPSIKIDVDFRMQIKPMLDDLFGFVHSFCQNPASVFADQNAEQLEIFLNHFCCPAQPMLHYMGNDNIDDQYVNNVVQLVFFMFQQHKKILTGGILLYHGLISAVEGRIQPFIMNIMNNLVTAMKLDFQYTDEFSMRNACGLITDISTCLPETVSQVQDTLVPLLKDILLTNQVNIEVKLHAIIAIGDVCLAGDGGASLSQLQSVMQSLNAAAQKSLSKGNDDDEISVYSRLRDNIIAAYQSVLHGMNDGTDKTNPIVLESATAMYSYVQTLVMGCPDLSFKGEVLGEIMQLYLDLVNLFCEEEAQYQLYSYYPSSQPRRVNELCLRMIQSREIAGYLLSAIRMLEKDQEEKSQQLMMVQQKLEGLSRSVQQ